MNIFLLKTILCAFISIVTVVGALSVQSCSNDFENSFEKKNDVKGNRYLDISNDTSQKNKLDILNKAFQRIGTQFVIKDDTCYLTVHSEKKLNMSSDVFALVRQSIEAANKQYDMFLLFKDNNMGIKIKNPFDLKLSITATRIEREISDGPNYSTTKLILSNSETITVLNEMRCANGLSTATTGLVTSGFIGPVLGSLLIVYTYFKDSELSNIQDEYAKSGSQNGITLTITTTTSPFTGMNITTCDSSINSEDKKND